MRKLRYHVSATFSQEQGKIIDEYLKKKKTTKSQLVKEAISILVPVERSKYRLTPKSYPILHEFFTELKKMFNSLEYQKKIERLFLKLERKYSKEEFKEFENFFGIMQTEIKEFEKKGKLGRPKIIRKRGRPKS
ncbi:hypothetical protein YTPLAS73_09510 [Nitrosarchaeum sp.]|nr:hypothetical protein YTPLAS73_09510 [Nitrosarchaeum sp.]